MQKEGNFRNEYSGGETSAAQCELLGLEESREGIEFGAYLRRVRQAKGISIRQLAKSVDKTAAYLSDIENGNNKPPDKELLEVLIRELGIDEYPRIRENLFDLAAEERNDVPADIKEYIMHNKMLLKVLRAAKNAPDSEQIWRQLANRV